MHVICMFVCMYVYCNIALGKVPKVKELNFIQGALGQIAKWVNSGELNSHSLAFSEIPYTHR